MLSFIEARAAALAFGFTEVKTSGGWRTLADWLPCWHDSSPRNWEVDARPALVGGDWSRIDQPSTVAIRAVWPLR